MRKFSVRKYYFIETLVEAEDSEHANDLVEEMKVDPADIQWLGDLENSNPDILEV